MPIDYGKTWLGVGEKTGGMLGVVGVEHTTGAICRASNPENPSSFNLTSIRAGLGLGFSGGLVGVLIFNCQSLSTLNGSNVDDWGVSVALGGQWSRILATLRRSEHFIELARLGWRIRNIASHSESLRNFAHYAYTLYDIEGSGTSPKIIFFDIPIGGGVEVSICFTNGRIQFS